MSHTGILRTQQSNCCSTKFLTYFMLSYSINNSELNRIDYKIYRVL